MVANLAFEEPRDFLLPVLRVGMLGLQPALDLDAQRQRVLMLVIESGIRLRSRNMRILCQLRAPLY